jgi:hypothetical protein
MTDSIMDELKAPTLDGVLERIEHTATPEERAFLIEEFRAARRTWKEVQAMKEDKKAK